MEVNKVVSYIVLGILIYSFKTQSCLFSRRNLEYEEDNIADEDASETKFCYCGQEELHHVFVNISFDDGDSTFRVCSGTMVTTNVIMVSHLCIQSNLRKLDVYDNWSPKSGHSNVIEKSNIQIFRTCNETLVKYGLSASKAVYNYRYAVTSMLVEFPTNAVFLLQVEADLTNGCPKKRPICLDPPESAPSEYELRIYKFKCLKGPPITPAGNGNDGNKPPPPPEPKPTPPPTAPEDDGCEMNSRSDMFPRDFRGEPALEGESLTVTILDKTVCKSKAETNLKKGSKYPSDKIFCIKLTRETFHVVQHEPVISYRNGEKLEYLFGTPTGYFVQDGDNDVVVYYSYAKYLTDYMSNHGCLDKSKLCRNLAKHRKKSGRHATEGSIQQSLDWNEQTGGNWENPNQPIPRPETQNCKCGHQNTNGRSAQGRVVLGEDANPYEFSWMTFIETDDGDDFCTGSVINNKIILTAAHCLMTSSEIDIPEDIKIYTNVHYRQTEVVPANAKAITEIVIHPGYVKFFKDENKRKNYDIALLVLKEPLEFNSGFCPICLPGTDDTIPTEQVGVFAGYGLTDANMPTYAAVLQKGSTTIWSRDECLRQMPDNKCTLKENVVCTLSDDTPYPYLGDSGAPLMVQNSKGSWIQIGVCSSLTYAIHNGKKEILAGYMNPGTHKLKTFIDYVSYRVAAEWCTANK